MLSNAEISDCAMCDGDDTAPLAAAEDRRDTERTLKSAHFLKAGAISTLALATAACGGGGSDGGNPATSSNPAPVLPVVLKPDSDAQAARFILRAGFAASDAEIARIKSIGYEAWLDQEIAAPIEQTAEQFFVAQGYDQIDSNRWYDKESPNDNMIWSQLMSGSNQFRKRIALAMSEFFVVSIKAVGTPWRSQAMGEYWDILNKLAFGNYRELLEEITLNPAMGLFLNTLGNRKADARTGRMPDENFGREVMQLFSIGLNDLNIDGTERAGPVESYTNEDVSGIAEAFTGYDYDYTGVEMVQADGNGGRQIPTVQHIRQRMTADPAKWRRTRGEGFHSETEKSFLGTTIPAGTGAAETLKLTLDALFQHPNVGPFFARQMIQRLVTSNPSPAYVQRIATRFNDNGNGTKGDLRTVFKAILLDEEALADGNLTNPEFGKLREPMLRFAQLGRTFGATSPSGHWNLGDMSDPASRLGQAPLRSPSVFNYFRPGYVPSNSEASARNLVAPEFQIVNETSVAGYVNFMERSVDGRAWWMRDVTIPYVEEVKIAHDGAALLARVDLLMTGGQMSPFVRDTILSAVNGIEATETSDEATKLRRVHTAVFLTAISLDYLIQQ